MFGYAPQRQRLPFISSTIVSRDGCGIYLSRGNQGQGRAWIWVGVEDVGKLHEEYEAKGIKIRLPPTNYSWALEMQIEDPDGNVLRLGSDPVKI